MKYTIDLTPKEIELIKDALDHYETPVTDMIEKTTLKEGFEDIHNKSKIKLKMISDLHMNICYQLSDQQNITPLSQRDYPQ